MNFAVLAVVEEIGVEEIEETLSEEPGCRPGDIVPEFNRGPEAVEFRRAGGSHFFAARMF